MNNEILHINMPAFRIFGQGNFVERELYMVFDALPVVGQEIKMPMVPDIDRNQVKAISSLIASPDDANAIFWQQEIALLALPETQHIIVNFRDNQQNIIFENTPYNTFSSVIRNGNIIATDTQINTGESTVIFKSIAGMVAPFAIGFIFYCSK